MRIFESLLIFAILFAVTDVHAQDQRDSVVMNYLRQISDDVSPFVKITKSKGKALRSSNFFIEPLDSVKHGEIEVNSFIFGLSVSHESKYLLLEIKTKQGLVHHILEGSDPEVCISELFNRIREYELSIQEKIKLVRSLLYTLE